MFVKKGFVANGKEGTGWPKIASLDPQKVRSSRERELHEATVITAEIKPSAKITTNP